MTTQTTQDVPMTSKERGRLEDTLLGICFLDPFVTRCSVFTGLKASHFKKKKNRDLFVAVRIIAANQKYIAELISNVPTATNPKHLAKRLQG